MIYNESLTVKYFKLHGDSNCLKMRTSSLINSSTIVISVKMHVWTRMKRKTEMLMTYQFVDCSTSLTVSVRSVRRGQETTWKWAELPIYLLKKTNQSHHLRKEELNLSLVIRISKRDGQIQEFQSKLAQRKHSNSPPTKIVNLLAKTIKKATCSSQTS
jgi:hypothetical protein